MSSVRQRLLKPFYSMDENSPLIRYQKYYEKKDDNEGVSFLSGVCLVVNIMMGSGFLTLPHLIQKSGLVLGPLIMIFSNTLMRTTARYEAEVMCRANPIVLAQLQPLRKVQMQKDPQEYMQLKHHTFTVPELCEIFVGKWLHQVYVVLILLYIFSALLGFTTVFATTMSNYVSLPLFNDGQTCLVNGSTQGCTYLRNFWICILALIVIPLSIKGVKEQATFQAFMACMRFLGAFIMAATCLYAFKYQNHLFGPQMGLSNAGRADDWKMNDFFNFREALEIVPVSIFIQNMNSFVNLVARDLDNKKDMRSILTLGMGLTLILYVAIGAVVAWYFYYDEIPETANILWANILTTNFTLVKPAALFVLLFPAMDAISVFSLNAVNMAGKLMAGLYHDRMDKAEKDKFLLRFFRLTCAIPPLICSFFVGDNLDKVYACAGSVAIPISMVIPAYLNIISQQKVVSDLGFRSARTRYSDWRSRPAVLAAVAGAGAVLFAVLLVQALFFMDY